MLAIHPRTLQRHLTGERTTFEALREDVRQEIALHPLRETHMPLGQLADLLGLSEHSAPDTLLQAMVRCSAFDAAGSLTQPGVPPCHRLERNSRGPLPVALRKARAKLAEDE